MRRPYEVEHGTAAKTGLMHVEMVSHYKCYEAPNTSADELKLLELIQTVDELP